MACPYAAFLRYEAAIRAPINEYLALGNALHLALELSYESGQFNSSKATNIFVAEFKRLIDEEEIFIGYPKKKKMEADGLKMLGLYAEGVERGTIAPNPLAHEVEFKIPFESLAVVGRIDKVEFDPALGYDIIDYKSGSKEPDPWFLRHNLQLTAYAWACQEIYGELPRKLIWHQLRSGKLLETERTQQDIDELKRMISNVLYMDKKDIRYRIYHEQVCNWCDYAGAVCDDRDLEERIVNERKKRSGQHSKGADSD
jgi:CRISPR/Cas system-associated exonuclease Cas4 (RecB family)